MTVPTTPLKIITGSPEETMEYGRKLASFLRVPSLVLLRGDLGAGKTTLVKGIAEGFQSAQREDVTSPTFTLIHEYRGPGADLFHIDLYRIDTLKELDTLALDDLRDERSVVLVEWGEKFERIRSDCDYQIAIRSLGEAQREICVTSSAKEQ